jgi:molybdopterin converting factor subunit 1
MKLNVLLFAYLREAAGKTVVEIELPDTATGGILLDTLVKEYPNLEKNRPQLKVAMDGEYIQEHETLLPDTEIAVFPPVSGG